MRSTALVHRPGRGETLVQQWLAFGCSDDGNDPTVRKSGEPHMYPDAEMIGGLMVVEVKLYGDEPAGAGGYVKVVGVDPVLVRVAWQRAAKIANGMRGEVWP